MQEPRLSQRQSLACRECTQKKRKCSKEIPCVRCRRLGLHCTREVVRLRRAVSQHGREIAFLASLRQELEAAAAAAAGEAAPAARARVGRALHRLTERVQQLQTGEVAAAAGQNDNDDAESGGSGGGGGGAATTTPATAPSFSESLPDRSASSSSAPRDARAPDPDSHDSLIVTALEHVAWGRNSGSCYPHRRCTCQYSSSSAPLAAAPLPFAPVAARIVADGLPGRALAERLVRFHLDHMAWHHNCVHAPTFLAQCRRFWDSGGAAYDHPQWLALYLAVLATAHFCVLHSPRYREGEGGNSVFAALPADPGAPASAQALFQAMLDVLHEAQYLQNVSLYAVQAIVISTEMAHNLGLSQLNATLFAAAVRIAECLGVHKIGDDDPVDDDNDDNDNDNDDPLGRLERLEREVGRRVWLQMVVQDHFAMPFTDAYGIHPAQYATGPPRNCDDVDAAGRMVEQPDALPTVSSYTRVLATLARLVPELADGLGPLRARRPLRAQYEHILAMDQKMRRIVRAIPPFFLRQDAALEARVPWLRIARQSMAITAAEKIVMVHRPFLFRAFQPAGRAAYAHTRRTCVSAAMTILREHRNITDGGDVSLWTHTAFCITAALLLSFEVLCSQGEADQADPAAAAAAATHRSAILYARTYLASRAHDILAQRGVLLLDALFPAAASPAAAAAAASSSSSLRFEDIVSHFTAGWMQIDLSMKLQQSQAAAAAAGFSTLTTLATPPQPVLFAPGTTTTAAAVDDDNAEYGPAGQPFPETTMSPSLEDFDVWFQHLFSTGQGAAFV